MNTTDQQILKQVLTLQGPAATKADVHFFNGKKDASGMSLREFDYICNPDGTLRWVYPKGQSRPVFLSMYHEATWKARLYQAVTYAAFGCGMGELMRKGNFRIGYEKQLKIEAWKEELGADEYAIFLGTAGVNRKSVVAFSTKRSVQYFLKVAHSTAASALVEQEKAMLKTLSRQSFSRVALPKQVVVDQPYLLLQATNRPPNAKQQEGISTLHIEALRQLYTPFVKTLPIGATAFYQELQANLYHISRQEFELQGPFQELYHLLTDLLQSIDTELPIQVSLGHGDFTPWNMYVSAGRLHLIDWELSRFELPLLYDAFHFCYQSGSLLKGEGYRSVQSRLNRMLALPETQSLITYFGGDAATYEQLYLLYVVSYYVKKYLEAPTSASQMSRSLALWNEALISQTPSSQSFSHSMSVPAHV